MSNRGALGPWLICAGLVLWSIPPAAGGEEQQFLLRAPRAAVKKICRRNGLALLRPLGHDHGVFLVGGPSGISAEQLRASEPQVEEFEPVREAVLPEVSGGPALNQSTAATLYTLPGGRAVRYHGDTVWSNYVEQPAAALIRVLEAHQEFATGSGTVAVIDTGADPDHPALKQALGSGYDFVNDVAGTPSELSDLDPSTAAILGQSTAAILDGDQDPVLVNQSTAAILDQSPAAALDTRMLPRAFGHGTMVAGLIHLVAPKAKIMPLKAFTADGSASTFDVARAIYYAVDNGANVITMSFSLPQFSPELMRAINHATRRGAICVASVGNEGQDVLVFPAALGNVLGVAATSDDDKKSPFSNFGVDLVTLTAPGQDLITTYPGGRYAAASGTSFSTALVAGAVALLLEIDIKTNFYQALDALSHAKNISQELGFGRIDLYEALLHRRKALGLQ